ncbi:mitochondrial ribosomal protein L29 [Haematococcus lacustris]
MQLSMARTPFAGSTMAPSRVPVRARSVAVALKPSKAADFKALTDEEMVMKIGDLKQELASVRFRQKTRGIEEIRPGEAQPQQDVDKIPRGHLNKHIRRQIAQIWTVLRERQIKEGISSRENKAMERKAMLSYPKKPAGIKPW